MAFCFLIRIRLFTIYLLLLILFICGSSINSRITAQNSELPRATLKGWENNLSLFIKDRSNNTGGFYYDRGLFRMHTVPMDMEYQLDMFTYQFSYFDDYQWYNLDDGFRTFVGSLNTSNFAVHSQLKNQLELSDRGTLNIVGYQQEDLRTQRGLISLKYSHRFGTNHQIGLQHKLGQSKTDLDATLFYQYGKRNRGMVTTEITILDWANNIVSDLSDSRNSEFEIRQIYSKRPFLYTLRLESPQLWIFRAEAIAAVQPGSQAEVFQRNMPDENYILRDWVNYQAVLIESNFHRGTAGIIYQRTFAKMEREAAEESVYPLEYGNQQEQQRVGVYFTYNWRGLGIEQWFWTERNRDLQFDENPEAFTAQEPRFSEDGARISRYPFDFNEIRRFNKTRLFYKLSTLTLFIEHNGDWRTPASDGPDNSNTLALHYRNFYPNHISYLNERLTTGVGITFNSQAKLTLGVSIDLDGDLNHGYGRERDNPSYALFDGGFGRLQILW